MNKLLDNINNRIVKLQVSIKERILDQQYKAMQDTLRGMLSGIVEVTDIVKEEFASYNDGWHKVEDGLPTKEGDYDITYIGIDPITRRYECYLTVCFFSEKDNAFLGYSSIAIAWRERPSVYIPEGGLPLTPVAEDW